MGIRKQYKQYQSALLGLVKKTNKGNMIARQIPLIQGFIDFMGEENVMTNGTKFKIGDKIICVQTPAGPVKPNIKKGERAVLKENTNGGIPGIMKAEAYFHVKNTSKKYCYWEEDNECYAKEEANLEETIERECKVLN